ncbi:MAG TPA: sugar ABC transporter ATP-binding protein [Gaiellaceae bacterium]|nr:sugar ABC transporter ATP-binding protein [Gaiellaceae bacterium]
MTEGSAAGRGALLELVDVHKRFGGTRALRGVDFDVRAGEVHALLGQNGSGKSTLMKVAYGELEPTSGRILVDGAERTFASPHAALTAGIAAVPQEVPVVPSLSVLENILLGRLPTRWGSVEWRAARRRAAEVLERLGSGISPAAQVSTLRSAERQIVAIARALAVDARILIFDEPTSSLTAEHAETLFRIMRDLKEHGVGMVFISQRLQDVHEVADRVTVMRDGVVAGSLAAEAADHDVITELMIGRSLTDYFHKREVVFGEPVLEVDDLSRPGAFEHVSLAVRAGEVVGIAGLVGCGRVELLQSIYGVTGRTHGRVRVDGQERRGHGPASSVRLGIGMVTGDRKAEGLVLSRSVHENLSLVRNRRLSLWPLRHRSDRRVTHGLMDRLRIQAPHADAAVLQLSGGNQQKVVLAKWLSVRMKVLLLDEPTRGVDVGAKAEIYGMISELAESGIGIVVSSSENPELLGICDRILVMFRGRVVAEVDAKEASERVLVEYSTGPRTQLGDAA